MAGISNEAESAIERGFVRAFVVADKQERYLLKLAAKRHRPEFLQRLFHGFDFEAKYARRIDPAQQQAMVIFDLLRKQGAPETCHAISARIEWDGKDLPLRGALDSVVGMDGGVILVCMPDRLAYFESEETGGRYILSRPEQAGRRVRK